MKTELERLQESADFWRNRANLFEEALRKIEAVVDHCAEGRAERRWEIAAMVLEESKQPADNNQPTEQPD